MVICDSHICDFERVVNNEIGAVFETTSVLNSIGAIFYSRPDEVPRNLLHNEYFDLYSDLGLNVGKLLRYSFKFDPKKEEAKKEEEDEEALNGEFDHGVIDYRFDFD